MEMQTLCGCLLMTLVLFVLVCLRPNLVPRHRVSETPALPLFRNRAIVTLLPHDTCSLKIYKKVYITNTNVFHVQV